MRSIKAILKFRMIYEALKTTTLIQVLHGKHLETTRPITLTPEGAPCILTKNLK